MLDVIGNHNGHKLSDEKLALNSEELLGSGIASNKSVAKILFDESYGESLRSRIAHWSKVLAISEQSLEDEDEGAEDYVDVTDESSLEESELELDEQSLEDEDERSDCLILLDELSRLLSVSPQAPGRTEWHIESCVDVSLDSTSLDPETV